VLQGASFVLCQNDDLSGPFGESFEQTGPFLPGKAIVAQRAEAVPTAFTEFLRLFRQM
jgi:hypothetical protein